MLTQSGVPQTYRVVKAVRDLVTYDVADASEVHVLRAVSLEERSLKNTGREFCGGRLRRGDYTT